MALLALIGLCLGAQDRFAGEWVEVVSTTPENMNPVTFEMGDSSVRMSSPLHKPSEWLLDGIKRPLPSDPTAFSTTSRNEQGGFTRRHERNGKIMSESIWALANDGTLLLVNTYYSPSGPYTQKTMYRRTGGTSGLTGTWAPVSKEATPTTMRITEESGVLAISRSSGLRYTVDGKPLRVNASPAALYQDIVMTKESANVIEKRALKNGETTVRGRLELSDDGQTLTENDEFTTSSGQATRSTTVFTRRR